MWELQLLTSKLYILLPHIYCIEAYLKEKYIFAAVWVAHVSAALTKTSDQFILKPDIYVWLSEGKSPKAGKIELLPSQAKGPRNRPPFEIIFGLN